MHLIILVTHTTQILNEVLEVDYMLTDVYSFGIILWELITRQQPYMGLRYALVQHAYANLCATLMRCAVFSLVIVVLLRWPWR